MRSHKLLPGLPSGFWGKDGECGSEFTPQGRVERKEKESPLNF